MTRKLHRNNDPETSRAAAKQASRVRTDADVGFAMLSLLQRRPCETWTDAGLTRLLGWKSGDRVRHGRLSLADNGYLADTGYRRPTGDGGTGRVWKLTAKGRRPLPRWASRITLEATRVRVERVPDISTEDIIAEGLVSTLREHDACVDLSKQWQQRRHTSTIGQSLLDAGVSSTVVPKGEVDQAERCIRYLPPAKPRKPKHRPATIK